MYMEARRSDSVAEARNGGERCRSNTHTLSGYISTDDWAAKTAVRMLRDIGETHILVRQSTVLVLR